MDAYPELTRGLGWAGATVRRVVSLDPDKKSQHLKHGRRESPNMRGQRSDLPKQLSGLGDNFEYGVWDASSSGSSSKASDECGEDEEALYYGYYYGRGGGMKGGKRGENGGKGAERAASAKVRKPGHPPAEGQLQGDGNRKPGHRKPGIRKPGHKKPLNNPHISRLLPGAPVAHEGYERHEGLTSIPVARNATERGYVLTGEQSRLEETRAGRREIRKENVDFVEFVGDVVVDDDDDDVQVLREGSRRAIKVGSKGIAKKGSSSNGNGRAHVSHNSNPNPNPNSNPNPNPNYNGYVLGRALVHGQSSGPSYVSVDTDTDTDIIEAREQKDRRRTATRTLDSLKMNHREMQSYQQLLEVFERFQVESGINVAPTKSGLHIGLSPRFSASLSLYRPSERR